MTHDEELLKIFEQIARQQWFRPIAPAMLTRPVPASAPVLGPPDAYLRVVVTPPRPKPKAPPKPRVDFKARNRRILQRRREGATYRAIGGEFGVSVERARQIITKELRVEGYRVSRAGGWQLALADAARVRGRRIEEMAALYCLEGAEAVSAVLGGHCPAALRDIECFLTDASQSPPDVAMAVTVWAKLPPETGVWFMDAA